MESLGKGPSWSAVKIISKL